MKWMVTATVGVALIAAGGASAQRADRNVEQPIARSFNWFAYVGAKDIREACKPGGRNRIRLIYNALYDEQVRTYEIFLQPDGIAGMNIGVLADQGNVSNLVIGNAADVLSPWSMKRGERLLPVTRRSGDFHARRRTQDIGEEIADHRGVVHYEYTYHQS